MNVKALQEQFHATIQNQKSMSRGIDLDFVFKEIPQQ